MTKHEDEYDRGIFLLSMQSLRVLHSDSRRHGACILSITYFSDFLHHHQPVELFRGWLSSFSSEKDMILEKNNRIP